MKIEKLKTNISKLLHNHPNVGLTDVYNMIDEIFDKKRKIVCLCGSTKFKKEFEEITRLESLKGNIVLTVAQFSHFDNIPISDEEKKIFDELHKRKIDMADEVFIVNVDGYIGETTKNEISYALKHKKRIIYLY